MEGELSQSAEQSAPVTSISVEQSVPAERTFKQSEVNELIGRVKREAAEKTSRLYAEQPQYAEQKYGNQQPAQQSAGVDEERVRRLAVEEFSRQRDSYMAEYQAQSEQAQAQKIVQNFYDKIAPGKEKYEDFEKVTGDLALQDYPNVVQLLAEHADNAPDVLYELAKDRGKLMDFQIKCEKFPRDAVREFKRLAESIKANEQAVKTRTPNEPLSQLRPSNVSTASGPLTMADLKRKYKG